MNIESLIKKLREANSSDLKKLLDQADEQMQALALSIESSSRTAASINLKKSYSQIAESALLDLSKWPDSSWEYAQIAGLANAARGAIARHMALLPPDSPVVIEIKRRRRS